MPTSSRARVSESLTLKTEATRSFQMTVIIYWNLRQYRCENLSLANVKNFWTPSQFKLLVFAFQRLTIIDRYSRGRHSSAPRFLITGQYLIRACLLAGADCCCLRFIQNQYFTTIEKHLKSELRSTFPLRKFIFQQIHYCIIIIIIKKSSLFTAACKNSPSARCVSVANRVCKDFDIVRKPVASLKQILR